MKTFNCLSIVLMGLPACLCASLSIAQTPSPTTTGATVPERVALPEEKKPEAELDSQKKVERIPGVEIGEKAEGTGRKFRPDDDYGKTRGLLGPVTLGFGLSLLGLPRPVEFSLQGKLKDYMGFQFTYGYLPTISISSVKVGVTGIDGRLRWHPFRGSFYLGGAFGSQTFTGSTSKSIQGQSINAKVDVKTNFMTPMIGWRWVWNSGFFMGMDLGWQLARSADTKVDTNAPAVIKATDDYKKVESDIIEKGNKLGKTNIPYLSLLSFGWLF